MIIEKIRKIFLFIFFKYWRIIYKIKYEIPFFDRNDLSKIINPIKYIEGSKSVAIIGKGASIFENNPIKEIEKCDCRILLSRVDVENLEKYIGNRFEVQIAPQVSKTDTIMQVLPRKLIRKYGIKLLICNLKRTDERFEIFNNFFQDRIENLGYMPDSNEMDFDVDIYKYSSRGSLTIASSVLRILYNVPSVQKIVFAGVDAYHFGYSQKQKKDGYVFLDIIPSDLETQGKPFIRYMIDSVIKRNRIQRLDLYFPEILKKYIDFPEHQSFKFYK